MHALIGSACCVRKEKNRDLCMYLEIWGQTSGRQVHAKPCGFFGVLRNIAEAACCLL